jgi:hypothetical protein
MVTMPSADHFNNYTTAAGFGAQPSWSSSSSSYYYNNDVCTWSTCGGHALHETKIQQSVSSSAQSWGSDYSNFVYSSYPWFKRGGYSGHGSYAGVFASSHYDGYGDSNVGFRVVAGSF